MYAMQVKQMFKSADQIPNAIIQIAARKGA